MEEKKKSFRYSDEGKKGEFEKGLFCALFCAVLWGVLPVYWKALAPINSLLIMFYRVILAFLFSLIAALAVYGVKDVLAPLKQKGVAVTYFFAGILISANWGIYIWAVNSGHIIQTSIGYYIEPLAVCVFGILFFHEKLNRYKAAALILAVSGVAYMLLSYGQLPLIALGLAFTFSTYAAIKKKLQVNVLLSMVYETMFMVPFLLPVIIYMEASGKGAFSVAAPHQLVLLLFCGVVTATPLMLFSMAAYRVDMITLGVTEYVSPSIALVLGIFLYQEPFDSVQLITFAIIWVGLAVFTFGSIRSHVILPEAALDAREAVGAGGSDKSDGEEK